MNFSYEANETLSLLWRATWQSSVLALLVAVTILVSRRWLAAKWRVVLWMLPLCRMLLLVVPASGLSIFNGINYLAELRTALPILSAIDNDLPPFRELNAAPLNAPSSLQGTFETSLQSEATTVPVAIEPLTLANERVANQWSLAAITMFLWLLGCVVLTLRWGWSALALRRTISRCEPLDRELWEQLKPASLASSRLHALFPVRCLMTELDLGPATCGLFRPTILLPQQLVSELTTDQLRDIISHEYQHIRRFDVLLLALSRCVRTIHWFNPVAYIVSRMLRREMELAVDAATISTLQVSERQAYGHLLIRLARRPASQFGLAQMADRKSAVKARIEAISNPLQTSPARSALAVVIIGTLLVVGCTQEKETSVTAKPTNTAQATTSVPISNTAQASKTTEATNTDATEPKYFVTGTVREAGTNQPIAGAEVGLLVESEQEPEKRAPKGISDAEGKYRIEVPMGNVKLWFPWLKPGYWLSDKDAMKDIVTSPEMREAVHDIIANQSPVWQIQAIGDLSLSPMISAMEVSDAAERAAIINHEQVTWNETPPITASHLDANGRAALTQVGTSGGLLVSVVNVQAELVVEPGFDNTRVVSADRLPDSKTTKLIDEAGKQATVTEAVVTLDNGVPLLTFQLRSTTPIAMQKLTGLVVDVNGKPLSGARVGAAGGRKNAGNSSGPSETVTDEDGRFQLDVPIQEAISKNLQFAAIITKDGYAGIDTEYLDAATDFKAIDFGSIKLSKGHSLPLQVVDLDGKPVAGATIEPDSSYSLRRQAVRSDANGHATLNNLPSGLIRVSARHGNLAAASKLLVSEDDRENTETILKLAETPSPQPSSEQRAEPLEVGAVAPDWDLKGWSDGKERKIADYRGKVLVLDFWGVWCGPCVSAIPSMQALAEKYEPRDVVFLGIHTPDGEFDQIRKLKKLHGWTSPSGIDRGTSNADGSTSTTYGIHGYPSLLIVDRQGKIAFNSGIEPKDRSVFMQEMSDLAKANGIDWPPNENAPQSEQEESMSKHMQAMFSREIDRVLE